MDIPLKLNLLGTPQIFVNQQPLPQSVSKKARALLFYLAVTTKPQARDSLMLLLWPEMSDSQARNNLRTVLPELNKTLGDHLTITTETVTLETKRNCWVDVHAFDAGIATPATLQQTLHLYQGEFLQGFHIRNAAPFEDWLLGERERLRLLLIDGLTTFSDQCIANGDYANGISAARRLLTVEPWLEHGHAQLMRLLAYSGQRSEALLQYETCKKMLRDEFDVAPNEEISALYQQIRAGDFAVNRMIAIPTANLTPSQQPLVAPGSLEIKPIPNNLSRPLSVLVGRSQELAYISQRLTDASCRLLTIVGPGGMGKTSLAQEAGQRILRENQAEFPEGIFFVPLLDIGAAGWGRSEPALADDPIAGEAILRAIAAQVGYKLEDKGSAGGQLQAYLRTRRLLLILDNFEHLLAGIDAVVALLTQAPQIKVLITSRARLNVRGESVLPLARLSLPTAVDRTAGNAAQTNPIGGIQDKARQDETWQTSEAIAMFVQRAQQVDPDFTINAETIATVEQICQLVDGLPLGIELATSMLPLLSCRALAEKLAESLDFLAVETRDIPSEQRTLAAVFERSWRLLPPECQQLLAKLAIFPGSFDHDAATQIAGASIPFLRRLLDQSLLRKVGNERYVMHRTVHAFAQQKLQQWPEQNALLHVQYAHFYLEFLVHLEQGLTETAYVTAIEQIQTELDNVRTAWRWSVDQSNLALLEISVGGLHDFYDTAGIYPEAIQLLEGALPTVRHAAALVPASTGSGVRGAPWDGTGAQRLLARLLCYTAQFHRLYPRSGEVKKAESWVKEALDLGHRLADPALQGLAYHELARLAQAQRDYAAMRLLSEQACICGRQANLPQLTAESLNDLGIAVSLYTHPLAGIPHFHEALDCLRQRPNRYLEVRIVNNLGLFHLFGHEYQAAYHYFQQWRPAQRLLADWVHLGDLWVTLGDYSAAQVEYVQGLAIVQARHAPYWESWLYVGYGRLQQLRGDPAAAQTTCRLAQQMAQKDGFRTVEQWALINLGHALAELGEIAAAGHCYQQAIALQKEMNWLVRVTDAHAGLAALCLAQNEGATAVTHAEAALELLAQQGLAAANEPFAVYWTCVRVLQAAGDPRARTVLATAYQKLQETAHQLEDERLRRSFLENVVVNRNLVAAAQAAGIATDPIIQIHG